MEIRSVTDLSPGNLNFYPEMPSSFQALDGEAPIGLLTIFAPTAGTAELTVSVAPAQRRRGVFRALIKRASEVLRGYGYRQLLYVCPSDSTQGQSAASHLALPLEHSEYLMAWSGNVPEPPKKLPVRPVREENIPVLTALSSEAFGDTPEEAERFLRKNLSSGRVALLDGGLLACAFLREVQGGLSLYGVAIPKALRGKGWGTALMASLLEEVSRSYPDRRLLLEVSSTNLPALRLYRSCGFTQRRRTDYYSQTLSGSSAESGR